MEENLNDRTEVKMQEEAEKKSEGVLDKEQISEGRNFASLSNDYASVKKAKVVMLQIPYEKTTTYRKGTSRGPAAIIGASCNMELFDEELNQETYRMGIHTMSPMNVEGLSPEEMVQKVKEVALEVLSPGKLPVALGGEHTITLGLVGACREVFDNLSVLQLDAHCDLRDEYLGSRLSHACVGRRLVEVCPVVQAGTRSLSKEEKEFLDSARRQANKESDKSESRDNAKDAVIPKIENINVYDILDRPFWKDEVANLLTNNVYVTIDLDVFDISLMPAVGTPEPGGIGWYELLELLQLIARRKNIVGFDVVELCPISGEVAPDFLAAKLIYKLLGYIFVNRK